MKIPFIATFLICFSCAGKQHAGPVFVDFENGDDGSSGESAVAAWKHCPGDPSAAGKARACLLMPGDTVFFKGGTAYRGMVDIRWPGKEKRRIVYDGNSAGTWGKGRAIIDGENGRFYGFYTGKSGIAHVMLRGFEVRNLKRHRLYVWESGKGIFFEGARSCEVAGCFVHDIGYWKNDGSAAPSGCGIVFKKPDRCSVTGCEVTRTGGTGIWFDGAQQCAISGNEIHDYITWGIDLSGGERACFDDTVRDNRIHDLYQYDNGFWKAGGDPPHTDYCFIRKGNGIRPVRNVVERNLFYNDHAFTDFGGTAMLFLSYADSTIIRNNIFINPHGFFAVFFGWTSTANRFHDNTIFTPRDDASGVRLETGGCTDLHNNIVVAGKTVLGLTDSNDEKGLMSDSNYMFCATPSQAFAKASPFTAWTFTEWKTRGYDAHSSNAASVADIPFVNRRGYPLACETMDLRLLPEAPERKP